MLKSNIYEHITCRSYLMKQKSMNELSYSSMSRLLDISKGRLHGILIGKGKNFRTLSTELIHRIVNVFNLTDEEHEYLTLLYILESHIVSPLQKKRILYKFNNGVNNDKN